MNFVILDLEWNGTYSRRLKGFMNEIIEFGAVKVDGNLHVLDTFDALVRPQVGKKISGKIRTLTNITNEELANGLQFMQVMSRFRKWMGDAVLMTWVRLIFWLSLKTAVIFAAVNVFLSSNNMLIYKVTAKMLDDDTTKQMGLSTSAQLLGINEEDIAHHRAMDDSMLSLRCLQKLYQKEALVPFIQDARTDAFYEENYI